MNNKNKTGDKIIANYDKLRDAAGYNDSASLTEKANKQSMSDEELADQYGNFTTRRFLNGDYQI